MGVKSQVGGDGSPPVVTALTDDGSGNFTVTLSEPLEPGTWTIIEHPPAGWSTCLGYLPADVSGSGQSDVSDIDVLISVLNALPGGATPPYATDINRSNMTNAQDILALINLLNGAGDYTTWSNKSLPPNPCN